MGVTPKTQVVLKNNIYLFLSTLLNKRCPKLWAISCCYKPLLAVTSGVSSHPWLSFFSPDSDGSCCPPLSPSLTWVTTLVNCRPSCPSSPSIVGKLGQKTHWLEQTVDLGKRILLEFLWFYKVDFWSFQLISDISLFLNLDLWWAPLSPLLDHLGLGDQSLNTTTVLYPFSQCKGINERKKETLKTVVSA